MKRPEPRLQPSSAGHIAVPTATRKPAAVASYSERQGVGERLTSKLVLTPLSLITFIAIWYAITSGFHIVKPLFFPSPGDVLDAGYRLRFSLSDHITATLQRVLIGLTIGSLGGMIIGLLMTANRVVEGLLDPQIESLRPIPPVAAIPFFILWFGLADTGKIILVSLTAFMVIVVTTTEAVRNVPPIFIRAASTLGATKPRLYVTVVLPAIIPTMIGGLRIAAATCFAVDIAAEFMGAQSGLGFVVMNALETINTDTILFTMFIIGILSALVDQVIRLGGKRLTRWSERS